MRQQHLPWNSLAAAGWVAAVLVGWSVTARAGEFADRDYKFSLLPGDDESVYAPPRPPREDEGLNQGGVNIDFSATYFTAYVYRGVNHNDVSPGHEKRAANAQFDSHISFNLGRLPHPFIGVFMNIMGRDPVSRFQEIRPYAGLEWKIRPFTFDTGVTDYIYPEREKNNTAEVWAKVTVDDSYFLKTDQPLLSPYGYAAYDYDLNKGWYIEAGVKHDFVIEDTGLTITAFADVGYISNIKQFFIFVNQSRSGFQHYDVGISAQYSLNTLFKLPKRYGDWTINGMLVYTNGINQRTIHTDTLTWGGVGIGFRY